MDKGLYNLLFKDFDGKLTVIKENGETKIGEIIKKYFKIIKKSNLLENNISNILFLYNTILIEPKDYDKTIYEYFCISPSIIEITVANKYNNYNYEIIESIDETPFTSIYKAKLIVQNSIQEFVAVKKIFKDNIKKEMRYQKIKQVITEEDFKSEIQKFNKEIQNMEICQCENSVKIYDYFDTEKEFIIIMELCDQNLMDVLSEKEKGFNVEEIKNILLQLNNAFRLMKKNNIIHRDIKTNNILVKYINKEKTKYKVLLCDYGISRQIASLTTNYMSHVGTHCYTAPEILNDEIYNYKCDLWSLGITIYEMYMGELPYEAESEKGLLNQIDDKGKTVFDVIKDDKLKNLLLNLLEKNQKKRYSWDDYFKDPFFEEQQKREINSCSNF